MPSPTLTPSPIGWVINNRNLFLSVLGAPSPTSGCQQGPAPPRAPFWVADGLCPHRAKREGSEFPLILTEGTNPTHEGPTPSPHLILITSQSPPSLHLPGRQFQHVHFGRIQTFSPEQAGRFSSPFLCFLPFLFMKARAAFAAGPSVQVGGKPM